MKNAFRDSTKRRRASKPGTARKKQKQMAPLAQAFTVEDTPYLPSSRLLRSTINHEPKPKSTVRKVPRSAKANGRDPFHVLNDDEVGLIITLLSARDTETLRRVSKLWKTSSEYHCGKRALLEHFPWAASKVNKFASREEANLQFRRYLYHQGSLLAGNATRAIKCAGVTDWHIGNNSLIWLKARTPGCYPLSICALKSDDGVSTKPFDIVELDAKDLDNWQVSIKYVQLVPDGELLVHLSSLERCSGGSASFDIVEKLVKMTRGKVYTWQIRLKAMINRPAIGKDAIYFLRDRQKLHSPSMEAAFCKASLRDGSVLYEIPLPQQYGINSGIPCRNTSLTLTPDESWAVWNDIDGRAYIFSTASGQVIHTFPRSFNRSVIISSVDNKIRDIQRGQGYSQPHSTVVSYNKKADAFVTERLCMPVEQISESWCFDGDRPIFCYLLHQRPIPPFHTLTGTLNHIENTTLDPFTAVGIRPAEVSRPKYLHNALNNEPRSSTVDDMQSVVTVTLPPRSMDEAGRRDLEVELPWTISVGDYFGMSEDYLVFYSRSDESLVLVDFWPTW